MPGRSLGNFGVDLISSLGGRPTPAAQKLFSAWQRWEGGHTANTATWNPLNLTAPGSGLPRINSVGVVAMPTYQEGVRRTAQLITSGYPAIARALATGQVNFRDPALQGDLNRWLSGKRTPGMTPYVSKIAGAFGQPLPATMSAVTPGTQSPQTAPPGSPQFDPLKYSRAVRDQFIQGGGRIDLMGLNRLLKSSYTQPQQQADLTPDQADAIPTTGVSTAAPFQGGGDWGGSKNIAHQLAQLGLGSGLSVMSEKRDRQSTASGGVSDHWTGSKNSYAYDLSNGSSPTKEMDAAARKILQRLGVNWDGKSAIVVSKVIGNHRVQVLYRTNVGGNHFNHVHVGVRKL